MGGSGDGALNGCTLHDIEGLHEDRHTGFAWSL